MDNEYNLDDIHGKVYWVDFPYIGLGEKPKKSKKILTEEELERMVI